MMNSPNNQSQGQGHSPFPMPGNSSDEGNWVLRLTQLIKRPVLFLVLLLVIENTAGVLSLRAGWTSYGHSNPKHMNSCASYSIYGKKNLHLGYRPMVFFDNSEECFTLTGWLWGQVKRLHP